MRLDFPDTDCNPLQAIIGGCACFWGGVLVLGVVYIAVVYIKRNFEPEDVKKKMKRALS